MTDTTPPPSKPGFLERLGLHRRELRAWAMYDWANSAFVTTVVAAVFPVFWSSVAADGLTPEQGMWRFGLATTVSILIAGAIAPVLGAIADYRAVKKPMLGAFMGLGVGSVGCMFFLHHGDWLPAAILFAVANIGAMGSFVFYDALLPHIAKGKEMDRVSTAGYAIGYLGGGLLLALNLAWILFPGAFGLPSGDGLTPSQQTLPARLAFLSVAVWWLVFSIPLFRRIPEPPVKLEPGERPTDPAFRVAFRRLGATFRDLRRYRQAFVMLVAFLIYSDGIGTIIRMAVVYGGAIGIDSNIMIAAILVTQVVGVPCSFLFGGLAARMGSKNAIYLGLFCYMLITLVGYFMQTGTHFLMLAALVGLVQGGTQALSRSLFASLIPAHKSGEFFSFYGVMDRFAGSIGSGILVVVTAIGLPIRLGILSILALFIVGFLLLRSVDVEEGRRVAREAEAA